MLGNEEMKQQCNVVIYAPSSLGQDIFVLEKPNGSSKEHTRFSGVQERTVVRGNRKTWKVLSKEINSVSHAYQGMGSESLNIFHKKSHTLKARS